MRTFNPYRRAIQEGYRSGLEVSVSKQLKDLDQDFTYEKSKVHYLRPARLAKYTPDFVLPSGIVVETKGRFKTDDRQKHLLIKNQHPMLEIRFVFSNPKQRISKQSKTTYAAWCEKNGFLYATKLIPSKWLKEAPSKQWLRALERAGIKPS